ncbi:hypothetical protein CRES_1336 [Corynebacterium resistens DSM 45100]|uniref:Uncharacterized protein n=1 Tax=Corynebacterium resistens (strain DSM 45100 / JCM 12819 / GTC 2026 / SICGH 158) TaxID=662755 RepID=F8DYM7_CORRG|nr:hypothetical protein CRES_1336 [Corynebacterium resistens DSM 45100]
MRAKCAASRVKAHVTRQRAATSQRITRSASRAAHHARSRAAARLHALRLRALHIQHLPQLVRNFHELGGVGHNGVNILIGIRDLVDPSLARPIDDPLHSSGEVVRREQFAGLRAREATTGAVRRGTKRGAVPSPLDDIAGCAHRTRDQRLYPRICADGALAGKPHLAPEVFLGRGVVVVTVDALDFLEFAPDKISHAFDETIHHLLSVQPREPLRPVKVGDVCIELRCALDEVGQVLRRQADPILRAVLLSCEDVLLRDPVAHSARARVEEQPHAILFVQAQFDEVVAAAQRPQLLPPLRRVRKIHTVFIRHRLELLDPSTNRLALDLRVVIPRRQRNGALDRVAQHLQVFAFDVFAGVRGFDANHPAADIHSNGGRNDGAVRSEDRAYGGSHTDVGVWHQGYVREYERHGGQLAGLFEHAVLDDGREDLDGCFVSEFALGVDRLVAALTGHGESFLGFGFGLMSAAFSAILRSSKTKHS